MSIVIGADHGGFVLKQQLVEYLKTKGLKVDDIGIYEEKRVDYPDIAETVCNKVLEKRISFLLMNLSFH
jgi:ribose 5-phosphate isomerase B